MRIFLSYTFRDGYLTEEDLKTAVERVHPGHSVFVDKFVHNVADVQARIEHEISTCDLLVGIATTGFTYSPWVQDELRFARRFGKPCILISPDRLRSPQHCSIAAA